MTVLGVLSGKRQPDPETGPKRLRECQWEPSASLKIPADWPSGVYLGRLTTIPEAADKAYWQNYVVFIVRDTRKADILFQCSDNTWQAYNKWGGYSLYAVRKPPQWRPLTRIGTSISRIITVLPLPMSRA